ncbi:MAG TPA: NAD(P)H-dependent oxidoreductase [Pyrinomonadaceae bacterium]|nr:NAD(P)H-dependent oxidoreductase [Pyrinomonadaceae bacterium]
MVKILGVSGSMRERSRSGRALKLTLEAAATQGADTRLLDLYALDLPMYRPDRQPDTEAVRAASDAVNWADCFVLSSPDYHGSMSGAMKNFLDYFWTEFAGKLFGYLCASHEKGLTVMDQMRTAVRQCYGWSLPYGVAVHSDEDFDAEGNVAPGVARRLQMLGRDVAVYGSVIRQQYERDITGDALDTFAARYRKKK